MIEPTDPALEDVRDTIQRFQRHYSGAINDYNASVIRSILNDIANAAAPKPRPVDEVLFEGIERGGEYWLDGPIRIEFHYSNGEKVVTHISSMVPKLKEHLASEGYSITHESETA